MPFLSLFLQHNYNAKPALFKRLTHLSLQKNNDSKCNIQKLENLFNFIKKSQNATKLLGIKKLVY